MPFVDGDELAMTVRRLQARINVIDSAVHAIRGAFDLMATDTADDWAAVSARLVLQQQLGARRLERADADVAHLARGEKRVDRRAVALQHVVVKRRIAEVAKLMVDAGLIVSTAFISPFRAERQIVRDLVPQPVHR